MEKQTDSETAGEAQAPETSYSFFRPYVLIPNFMFIDEFGPLSNTAKDLYVFLHNAVASCCPECGVEAGGECSVAYTRGDMAAVLGVSERTAANAMRSLREAGLVEERRTGQGGSNHICVRVPGGPGEGWKNARPTKGLPPTWEMQRRVERNLERTGRK